MSKTYEITDSNIVDIIKRDIEQMDADSLEGLIEYMYNVKATYDAMLEGFQIEPQENSVSVEETFGEDIRLFNTFEITDEEINDFIDEFGVRENEPLDIILEDNPKAKKNDAELMIGLGYFWNEKRKVFILKESILYEERQKKIVEHLKEN